MNNLIADGITNVVRGLIDVLLLVLTGIGEVIFWFVELIMNGVLVCLFSELIEELLGLLKDAVGAVVDAINSAMEPILTEVGSIVQGATNAIGDIEKFIDGLAGIFTSPPKMPDLSGIAVEVDKLANTTHIDPTSVLMGISDIQSAVNFSSLQRDIQFVIDMPFEIVKTLLNESFGNWTMDSSIFPIAEKESLTFCTGNDALTKFFDALFITLKNAKTIAIAALVLLAVLAAILMAWLEVKRYNKTVSRSETLRDRQPMDIVYLTSRPLTATSGLWISKKIAHAPERQMLARWCIAYSTSHPALFVLSLAIAGALSALSQLAVSLVVRKEAPHLATDIADVVSAVLNKTSASSARWADESNTAVMGVQDELNDHVLAYARNATSAVGNALWLFENKTQDVLKDALGDTALYSFVDGAVGCILLDRLDEARRGLAWVQDRASVSLPLLPVDLFSAGFASGGANSSLVGLLGSSGGGVADEIVGAVDKVVAGLRAGMIQEGLMALVLFLVYVLYVFLGAAQTALRMCCLRDR